MTATGTGSSTPFIESMPGAIHKALAEVLERRRMQDGNDAGDSHTDATERRLAAMERRLAAMERRLAAMERR